MGSLTIEVCETAREAARHAAHEIARRARQAPHGCVLALSGGSTPRPMLEALGREVVPWGLVSVVQTDERVAPAGHPDRNLTMLRELLVAPHYLPAERLRPMPVEAADLESAARDYARLLEALAGAPPELEVVHLGLGEDGHTASLVPGDPVLELRDADVGLTRPYAGRRRMTLTYPVLERARRIVWLVTGAAKRDALARLAAGDASIPAGRVPRQRASVYCDRAAVGA